MSTMFRLFGISSSGYYEWRSRPASKHTKQDQALKTKIKKSYEKSRETYGARRIQSDLNDDGEAISRTRIHRLMKEENIKCKAHKKFKATTYSDHGKEVACNVLNREFNQTEANKAYVGDITYISTREGWLYLSVFIDLFSKQVVGWAMSDRMYASLVTDSLTMAMFNRRPSSGLIVHSDRGSQYVSSAYKTILDENGFVCSMSRKGNCWDNAPAESFFHTLKTELVHHEDYKTRDEAKKSIFEYIAVFYNRQRKHSSCGYLAPEVYEQNMAKIA